MVKYFHITKYYLWLLSYSCQKIDSSDGRSRTLLVYGAYTPEHSITGIHDRVATIAIALCAGYTFNNYNDCSINYCVVRLWDGVSCLEKKYYDCNTVGSFELYSARY